MGKCRAGHSEAEASVAKRCREGDASASSASAARGTSQKPKAKLETKDDAWYKRYKIFAHTPSHLVPGVHEKLEAIELSVETVKSLDCAVSDEDGSDFADGIFRIL